MKILKVVPLLVMVLVLLGCSFTVSVPTVQTGTTEILNINEAYPANVASPMLEINMGAGKLNLASGSDVLVSGEVHYNVADWKPTIKQTSTGLSLSQKQTKDIGFPSGDIVNDWTLKLGKNPFGLKIAAGAYEGTLDLSGVPLTSLEIADGASKSSVLFSTPNPVKMSTLVYKTGASQVSIEGIGNANVSDVTFSSGAGAYTLDFTGAIQQDILCTIKTGVSDLKLILPKDVHSVITITGGLGNVNATGAWNITGSKYENGSGSPTIDIQVDMALGNLTLSQK